MEQFSIDPSNKELNSDVTSAIRVFTIVTDDWDGSIGVSGACSVAEIDHEQHRDGTGADPQGDVTQGQWKAIMGTEPWKGKEHVNEGESYPASYVSWFQAGEFCQKLSKQEAKQGGKYRLPTEAEWEYACRAGSKTAYSFGESSKSLGDYAWFNGNSNGQTHPVGEKKVNAWGLYGMNGNVWEWCSDWDDDYPKGALSDPTGPKEDSNRVYRGGSWYGGAADCGSGFRLWYDPSYRNDDGGFRLALSTPD